MQLTEQIYTRFGMPFTTSGQETEWALYFGPRTHTGLSAVLWHSGACTVMRRILLASTCLLHSVFQEFEVREEKLQMRLVLCALHLCIKQLDVWLSYIVHLPLSPTAYINM